MKIIRELRSAVSAALDVPSGALGERVCVSTSGFYDTVVDGCSAIVDYSPSHLILECGGERVVIEGDGLRVSVFSLSRVRVCGKVSSITNAGAPKNGGASKNAGAPTAAGSPRASGGRGEKERT